MTNSGEHLDWYIGIWNVRLGLSKTIEISCPKCGGCASPYFIASLTLRWDDCDMQKFVSKLPFPTRVEELPDENGYKVYSYPNESESHPDIYTNNHSGEEERSCQIVSHCTSCHARVVIGNQVSTKDLYWHVHTRHGVLWAYSRNHLVELRDYFQGSDRPRGPEISRLPAVMLKGTNRSEMTKLIDRVLLNGPKEQ